MREFPPSPGPWPRGHRVRVLPDAAAASAAAADRIEEVVTRGVAARRAVLGLATGRTPVAVYEELVRRHREEGLSFHEVETFNLDEYWPIDLQHPASFHRFMHDHLFDLVDLPRGARHVPDGGVAREDLPEACAEYERRIRTAGGIDLQLLGIGANGHIGFNEPGSPRDGRTRLVDLHPRTIADNAAAFGGAEAMPGQAITMGVGTILDARAILVLALGAKKAPIVRRALLGPVTADVPASLLRGHPAVDWVLDAGAASELP